MSFTTTLAKAVRSSTRVDVDGVYGRIGYPDFSSMTAAPVNLSSVFNFDTNQAVTIADDGSSAVSDTAGIIHTFVFYVFRPLDMSDVPTPLLPVPEAVVKPTPLPLPPTPLSAV